MTKKDKETTDIIIVGRKNVEDFEQSTPEQLELFKSLYKDQEGYSNTVELYDVMPKYYFGGVSREAGKYLDNLHREFQCRDKQYKITITPASLTMKDSSTKHFYPSQREELVEDVIRKFMLTQSIYLAEKQAEHPDRPEKQRSNAAVKFTYYEIQQELSKRGHGYNISEIKQAIEICSKSIIETTDENGVTMVSTIFPFVGKENNKNIKGGKNRVVVMLHPLVTRSINEGTYRAINYEKVMSYKMALSRWLHKKISHYYTQIGKENPYPIKLSTIIRDSGMKQYEKISHTILQVKKALDEMKKNDTLSSYVVEIDKKENSRVIVDAKFLLYASNSFISEVKKANHLANLQLDNRTRVIIDVQDVREEMEKSIYKLSKTFINNYLHTVISIEDKESTMNALMAAKENIEKKENCNAAAFTKAALKEKWLPSQRIIDHNNTPKVSKTTSSQSPKIIEIQKVITPEELKLWHNTHQKIRERFGKEVFDKWLSKISPYSLSEEEFIMSAPSKFLRDWIKREFLENGIKDIVLSTINPDLKKISIIYVEENSDLFSDT